uniref:Uncharacterized protein n=1 Tax=Sphaerodactylus townsendi TaxID=933632 RepID=A0ACB8FQP4_9SAUR
MYNFHSVFVLLSLTPHPFQGRFQNLPKEKAIYKLLQAVPEAARSHTASSYRAFGDLEVFLHSLELEHLSEVLKETETTLRQLLNMGKEDFIQIGIKDIRDQQKILEAVKELHVEEVKLEELPQVTNIEFSGDEFLNLLVKLNRQCIHLTTAVQSMVNQFPTDFHKLVLEWNSPKSLTNVCQDLVSSADCLNGEVIKLTELIEKLQDGQSNDPCRIQLLERKSRWSKTFLKMAAVTLFGYGCVFLITKITLRKS